eukprot:TRINITY_DN219_c0_g1_i1.p1 TRINITY_DN219_c0_g1~~TRINITY_DN219_c0_g1_i1.p1  ORF type:complete len:839 (+),score=261.42 TRINITY_DN219_c0_g1_i1:24-2519(+)
MRLKITQAPKRIHTKIVTGVGWNPQNELFSVSDDQTVLKWSLDNNEGGNSANTSNSALSVTSSSSSSINTNSGGVVKICDLDCFATCFHWFASQDTSEESFAIGCSNGSFRIMNKAGKVIKMIKDAHVGAITAIRWNYEGTGLLTGGEDGYVKHWSRTGNLRSKLVQEDRAIYACCWSPDNQSVLYASGPYLIIKSLRVESKPIKWKAHDSTVLKIDWNPIHSLIVSGGEDCKYKVWDSFGRLLFSSKALEYPVTAVKWSPNGDYFAVGSSDLIALCDKTGWTYSREHPKSGSIMSLDWSSDGTSLAAGGANGAVCFGQLVERKKAWGPYESSVTENNGLQIIDVSAEQQQASSSSSSSSSFSSSSSSSLFMGEELNDFASSKIIDHSIGYRHLIVVTTKNCFVYSLQNLSSPHMIDLKGTVTLILQCEKYFLLVDQTRGIQIFSYEGRLISNPKISALRPHLLKNGSISLSPDALALIDRTTPTQVHVLDVTSGKPLTDPITHSLDIMDIAFSQSGMLTDRKLAFVDRNRDLYICPILRPAPFKLASMVESFMWSARDEMLAAVTDQKLVVWYCPAAAFVDPDLLVTARSSQDATSLGKGVQCGHFDPNGRLTLRRADGTLICRALSPFPSALHRFAQQGQFARALRLCRLIKDEALWACLAVLALQANQLDTAEVALAAIDEADKVTLIQSIKHIPTVEGRNAELLVYKRRLEDAETLLIQAKLYYRAIKLNLRFFRFPRALELAKHYKQHIDLVIGTRQKYLTSMEQKETDSNFLALQNTKIDWDTIAARESLELKNEQERGTPYQSDVFSDNSSSASSSSSSSASST